MLLALSIGLAAGASARAVELRGFRGVLWGDAVEKLGPQARFVRADGSLRCFARPTENLLFGDTPLSSVQFCFGASGLARVWVEAAAPWTALRGEFEQGYGAPSRSAGDHAYWAPTPGSTEVEIRAGAAAGTARMRVEHRDGKPRPD